MGTRAKAKVRATKTHRKTDIEGVCISSKVKRCRKKTEALKRYTNTKRREIERKWNIAVARIAITMTACIVQVYTRFTLLLLLPFFFFFSFLSRLSSIVNRQSDPRLFGILEVCAKATRLDSTQLN